MIPQLAFKTSYTKGPFNFDKYDYSVDTGFQERLYSS